MRNVHLTIILEHSCVLLYNHHYTSKPANKRTAQTLIMDPIFLRWHSGVVLHVQRLEGTPMPAKLMWEFHAASAKPVAIASLGGVWLEVRIGVISHDYGNGWNHCAALSSFAHVLFFITKWAFSFWGEIMRPKRPSCTRQCVDCTGSLTIAESTQPGRHFERP